MTLGADEFMRRFLHTAALAAAAQSSAAPDHWIEAHQGRFAALIVGVVVASFVAGLRFTRVAAPGDAGAAGRADLRRRR